MGTTLRSMLTTLGSMYDDGVVADLLKELSANRAVKLDKEGKRTDIKRAARALAVTYKDQRGWATLLNAVGEASPALSSSSARDASHSARDTSGLDQERAPIPWASVNPVVQKVVQLLHQIQAGDDIAVMEDVEDSTAYIKGADAVGQEVVPDAE